MLNLPSKPLCVSSPVSMQNPSPAPCSPQELVTRKLELAQLSETEVIARRELYKAKELNMKLASKLTKMEAHVYSRR